MRNIKSTATHVTEENRTKHMRVSCAEFQA